MKPINTEELEPVKNLFNEVCAFMKDNFHPESEEDWQQLVETARTIPNDEDETPLHRLGVEITVSTISYIEKMNMYEKR